MLAPESGAQSNPVARADDWLTPWRFAALLAILIAACFPNVISGLESFYFRDYALFGYPLAAFHKDAFWRGEIPLWNPYNDCGLPFLAQWNTLTLYPLSLFYLVLPLPWSLSVFCLLHLFLAGLGMYFLAYRWTGNRLAAAVGGVAFAYNGLTWHSLMWPNDIAGLAWMPWVILCMDSACRKGGRQIAIAAIAGAMQMLSGAPEIILLTWIVVGVFWLGRLFTGEVPPLRMICRTGCATALIAGIATAQLLPFLDLLAHSHRDSGFSTAEWAMPPSGLANYLVPLFHEGPAGRGVYMQHGQYWISSYFAGVGVVALALLAVWRVRDWRVWLLAALAFGGIAMALGNNSFVYGALRKILPILGFMRYPIKFIVLVSFALPLLAALGVSWLREIDAARSPREWRRLRTVGFALLGLIAAILILAWRFPQAGDELKPTLLNGGRSAIFLVAILAVFATAQRSVNTRRRIVLHGVLLVLLWMDVYTHVPAMSPTVVSKVFEAGAVRESMTANGDLRSPLQLTWGDSRIMESLAALRKMYFGGPDDPVTLVYGERAALYDDINLLDRVPKLDGFYSLYLREMNAVITDLYQSSNDVPRLKDFLGIGLQSHSTNLMDWAARPNFAPLITGGQTPLFLDDRQALRFLFETNFDGRKFVALPPDAKNLVHATGGVELKFSGEKFSDNRISASVSAPAPAIVVVAQAWYHPWRAYVDGQRTPLWRANYAFQALQVPAGQHRVDLVYHDTMFIAGGIISLISLCAAAAVWFFQTRGCATKFSS